MSNFGNRGTCDVRVCEKVVQTMTSRGMTSWWTILFEWQNKKIRLQYFDYLTDGLIKHFLETSLYTKMQYYVYYRSHVNAMKQKWHPTRIVY